MKEYLVEGTFSFCQMGQDTQTIRGELARVLKREGLVEQNFEYKITCLSKKEKQQRAEEDVLPANPKKKRKKGKICRTKRR